MEYVVQGTSELVILDYITKEPLIFLPECHLAHLNIDGEYKTSSGGAQGLDILGWNRSAGDSFIIYTPLLSMKFLELSSGSDLKVMNNSVVREIEQIEIDNTDTFETEYNIDSNSIKVYQLNQSGRSVISKLSINTIVDNIVTLSQSTDGWLLVLYDTLANIEELMIGKFINKGFYSLLGEVDIYNRNDATKERLKFEFPKLSINHSFNVKMLNNTDTGQMFTMECQALVDDTDNNKNLLRIMKRIEDIESS